MEGTLRKQCRLRNLTNPTSLNLIPSGHQQDGSPVPTRSLTLRWSTCLGHPSKVRRTVSIWRPTSVLTRRPRSRSRQRRVCSRAARGGGQIAAERRVRPAPGGDRAKGDDHALQRFNGRNLDGWYTFLREY